MSEDLGKMSKKKDAPEIRFPGFTDAWEQRKLKELASFAKGSGYSKTDIKEQGTPLILYGRLYTKYETKIDDVDTFAEPKKGSVYSKGNEVIVPASGETAEDIARASFVAKSGVLLGGDLNIIYPNESIEPTFLALSISNGEQQKNLAKKAQGKSVVHLHNCDLETVEIAYPTIAEQKQIGQYFQNLDHLITLHQRKLDKLHKYKKAMLQKMFPQNGADVPEIRFPGFTEPWEQRKLGELTIYRNGTGHEEKQSESGKYELINLNSISIDGGLKPSGKFIDEETETLLKDDLVMVLSDVGHGDLLGRVAIIPENNRFVLNQRVALLRNNSSVDIKYLFSYINAHQIYFKKQGAGSSQLNISRGSVENFEVLLPHKDEQKKIGKYLSSIDNLITLHQRKCEMLQKYKKAMLQKMFV